MWRTLSIAVLATACPEPDPGCDDVGGGLATVTVTDENGDPVEDADVVVEDSGESCEGGSDGVYHCGEGAAGEATIVVDRDGYVEARVDVSATLVGCVVDPDVVSVQLEVDPDA